MCIRDRYIKEFNDGLQDILIVQDHFGSLGGGVVDIDNDGDEDFYFFQEDISRPGLVFYLNEGVSSTHEIANTAVHIYPNPATEIINIDFDAPLNFNVNLYDLKGVLIEKFSNKSLINVNSISTGTYLLEIQDLDSAQKIVEKIVIGR